MKGGKRGGRSSGGISHDRWVAVWRAHWKGIPGRAIARHMGLSHTTVQWYLKKGCPPGVHPPKEQPPAPVVELRPRPGRQAAAAQQRSRRLK
jgi:hypothetical protein